MAKPFTLVRENGSIVWESDSAARLMVIRLQLLEAGIITRVVRTDNRGTA